MASLLKGVGLAAVLLSGVSATQPATTFKTTGVLIPLYVYPGKIWDEVIRAKYAHVLVPMVIVANVDNGPGSTVSTAYLDYIEKAQKAGIDVIGYVYTKYAKRSQRDVDADALTWYQRYHTDGIFLDQMADDAPYYQAVTAYAHSHALWLVIGNPGTSVSGDSGPDVINFFERHGYPSMELLKSSTLSTYGKSRWSYIADDVSFNLDRIIFSTHYVGYLYATDAKEPECYCRLPSYFSTLVETLGRL
jgi:Spherulation-specific family 4